MCFHALATSTASALCDVVKRINGNQRSTVKPDPACARGTLSSLAVHADGLQVAVSCLNIGLNALVGGISIGGDAAVSGLVVLVLLHLHRRRPIHQPMQPGDLLQIGVSATGVLQSQNALGHM